jgi:hypothetical protein
VLLEEVVVEVQVLVRSIVITLTMAMHPAVEAAAATELEMAQTI